MQTISWGDVNYARDTVSATVRDKSVAVSSENIARWIEDPDGRFEIVSATGDEAPAELGKFYPSL